VPTRDKIPVIIGYFQKIFDLNEIKPCYLAGFGRPVFPDRLQDVRKLSGNFGPRRGNKGHCTISDGDLGEIRRDANEEYGEIERMTT